MGDIDIFSFLEEITTEEKPIGYLNHPAKHWPIEEKLLYLQGLALVMNADGEIHADEKQYLNILTHSMEMDEEQTWEVVEAFAKSPDKETVLAFFNTFRKTSKAQLFLYEALNLSLRDGESCEKEQKVIEKMAAQLELMDASLKTVKELFAHIQAQAWQKSVISLSSQSIDPSLFRHLYEEVGLESLLLGKLVEIPAGSFMMGSNKESDEQPVHKVDLRGFKMQEAQLTFAQWELCVAAGGCAYQPNDQGWGKAERPVINVSYDDITQLYLPWLNRITGKNFRLPSEAEWEYACRAGTTTEYSWGNDIGSSHANYGVSEYGTVPVKSYQPNAFGLYDMHGNVWEWTQDCWSGNYNGAPADGSAWQKGEECDLRVLRGGSWNVSARSLRAASRYRDFTDYRNRALGFRLVQDC